MTDGHFEGSSAKKRVYHGNGKESTGDRPRLTNDVLPDIALLNVFDFYMYEERIEAWHTLVHVCRLWRNLVFGSPRRLNLRLGCTGRTPVREMLEIWPLLPIVVIWDGGKDIDNIIATLGYHDRICQINLSDIPSQQVEEVLAAMQQPFPALTHLRLRTLLRPRHGITPVDSDSFLGGSTPHLQELFLECVPFTELPKLLLSATHLVTLELRKTPYSGYVSSMAMVTFLSALTRLECLAITVDFPRGRPDSDHQSQLPLLQTRALFPVLTKLRFKGVIEYLEALVAHIDAPLLIMLAITFLTRNHHHTPQLTQFISRTPNFNAPDEARVVFSGWHYSVSLAQSFDRKIHLRAGFYFCRSDRQLSHLVQVCNSSFLQALIPTVERLYINGIFRPVPSEGSIGDSQWPELLHLFPAVKSLYVCREFVPLIIFALQELVGERVIELLPSLETLFLEDTLLPEPVQETIGQFVAARQLSGHTIVVSRWDKE